MLLRAHSTAYLCAVHMQAQQRFSLTDLDEQESVALADAFGRPVLVGPSVARSSVQQLGVLLEMKRADASGAE